MLFGDLTSYLKDMTCRVFSAQIGLPTCPPRRVSTASDRKIPNMSSFLDQIVPTIFAGYMKRQGQTNSGGRRGASCSGKMGHERGGSGANFAGKRVAGSYRILGKRF